MKLVLAEGIRSQDIKRIEESIRGLKESSEKQAEVMNEMRNLAAALHTKYEQITEKVSQSSSEPAVSLSPACSSNGNNWYTRFAKIEFPKFYVHINVRSSLNLMPLPQPRKLNWL